ncbi:MAG: translation initiation factor IF-2 [Candidatus Pacearchaeota archaeon]
MRIRQPIVTVCGHVDHGKTSILDKLRETKIQEGEAGGITQKISFSILPKEKIKEKCKDLLEKFKIPLDIPGFLFIDTPGHAAFTNLRKRGGSLADLAVLVIDINEGLKPQTIEILQILKINKTPFVIALNKIDNISGWKFSESKKFIDSYEKQGFAVKQNFDEKLFTLIGSLQSHKINAELYFKITDFTKNFAIVPCSAKTNEGIEELLTLLCALSQKFLKKKLTIGERGKGIILEIKKEQQVNFLESIIFDGELKEGDEIAIGSFSEIIKTKVRSLQEALPLNKGYKSVKKVSAASGVRILISSNEKEIYSGMPFVVLNKDLEEVKKELKKEIAEEIKTDETGILVKAESLGSLEALLNLLRLENIKVKKAEIGEITKSDIIFAKSLEEENKIILGFNVEKAKDLEETKEVKIILGDIVYKIIEELKEYRLKKEEEEERKKLELLPSACKLKILNFVFRNSNPAIFGVKIELGKLKKETELINSNEEKIGKVKTIQSEKKNIEEAESGKEVAICVPGLNFERELKFGEYLYSNISENEFRLFKENKNLLTEEEKKVLQEIATIKRKKNPIWGM